MFKQRSIAAISGENYGPSTWNRGKCSGQGLERSVAGDGLGCAKGRLDDLCMGRLPVFNAALEKVDSTRATSCPINFLLTHPIPGNDPNQLLRSLNTRRGVNKIF